MTLQHSLERSFEESLELGQADVLRQCLRTYATIDKMRDAEALFRKIAVKPYMDKVCLFYIHVERLTEHCKFQCEHQENLWQPARLKYMG